VLRSFRDKDTARLCHREPIRKVPHTVHRVALRKLVQLDAVATLDDLLVPPGNRLEKLRESRAGHHSIRINDQWRVCFRWERGDAYDVEIVDYH
jgi:toxin HigB-1